MRRETTLITPLSVSCFADQYLFKYAFKVYDSLGIFMEKAKASKFST